MRLVGRVGGGPLDDLPLAFEDGQIDLEVDFQGTPEPRVDRLEIRGSLLLDGQQTDCVEADGEWLWSATERLPSPKLDLILERLVSRVSDVRADAEVLPDEELLIRFQHGVELTLSPHAIVRVAAAAEGTASEMRLCEPLVVQVGGEGLRVSHRQLRLLSSLAAVRISRATLHPDGRVHLDGAGSGSPLDRAVRGGLKKASARLSDLVRHAPQFARVRSFLHPRD